VEDRGHYNRSTLRYPSDPTDTAYSLTAPLIAPAKRGGHKRRVLLYGVTDILRTECQCSARPKDRPKRSTVNGSFRRWDWDGTLGRIHHALHALCRDHRHPGPADADHPS
jgi:transposase